MLSFVSGPRQIKVKISYIFKSPFNSILSIEAKYLKYSFPTKSSTKIVYTLLRRCVLCISRCHPRLTSNRPHKIMVTIETHPIRKATSIPNTEAMIKCIQLPRFRFHAVFSINEPRKAYMPVRIRSWYD